ncbi:hypothetical protein [Sphingosinicella terrae]|uniref:hypothetical protein n=1 Tax=Sphingosinicella terrae TaxID=2172047 RepID=UPI000E0CF3AB|nr:hypothetical protein [Sphingosinicella terrae]
MGLLDLFRRGPAAPAERFPLEKQGQFDRSDNRALLELLDVAREERGADWNERFIELAWLAAVRQPHAMAIEGPDGFPYLRLDIASPGLRSQCLANVAEDCLERGWGVAFYAGREDPVDQPAYVVPFGRLLSIVEYDSSEGDPIDIESHHRPLPEGSEVVEEVGIRRTVRVDEPGEMPLAVPRPDFLPPYAARAMGSYLEEIWGLEDPRVLFVADPRMRPGRALMIGRPESDFPPDQPASLMVDILLWFLPPRRPILLMAPDMELEDMVPLRTLAGLEPGEDWWG